MIDCNIHKEIKKKNLEKLNKDVDGNLCYREKCMVKIHRSM